MSIAAQLNKMLLEGISGNQRQLVKLLNQHGIETTQSSVSRALKKINAIRGIDSTGNTIYSLPKPGQVIKETGFFEALVHSILNNGNLIVIHTKPGTANTVAKFIDDHGFNEILGTIAGDDTIMIVPSDVLKIVQVVDKIGGYLKGIGIF